MEPSSTGKSAAGGNGTVPDTATSESGGISTGDAVGVGTGAAALAALKTFLAKKALEKGIQKSPIGKLIPQDPRLLDKVRSAIDLAKTTRAGSLPSKEAASVGVQAVRNAATLQILLSLLSQKNHDNPALSNAAPVQPDVTDSFEAGKLAAVATGRRLTEAEIPALYGVLSAVEVEAFIQGNTFAANFILPATSFKPGVFVIDVTLPNSKSADP